MARAIKSYEFTFKRTGKVERGWILAFDARDARRRLTTLSATFAFAYLSGAILRVALASPNGTPVLPLAVPRKRARKTRGKAPRRPAGARLRVVRG